MRSPEEALLGILQPLSKLLNAPLEIDAAGGVRRRDGQPLSELENQLTTQLLDLIRASKEQDARVRALGDQITALRLENFDLITKNKALEEFSARDSLTGLYNRWFVLEKIDSEINRALRSGQPMSVLMIDLDHFKQINDSFGHPAGDEVLKSVGSMVRESCRVYDVAGRYGGEEFCVVLPDTRVDNTPAVAERIRHRLASTPLRVAGSSVTVTASIGVAGTDLGDTMLSAGALVERADRALYAAKHHGRNRVEVWESH